MEHNILLYKTKKYLIFYNSKIDCIHILKAQGDFVTNSIYTKDFEPISSYSRLTKAELKEVMPIVTDKLVELGLV